MSRAVDASRNGDAKGKTKNHNLAHNFATRVHAMVITMVWSQSMWAFHESCTTDDGRSELSSNGVLAREVNPENAYGYAAIFL